MAHRALPPQRGTDPQPAVAPDRRSFRRNYLDGNAFEWYLSLAAVVSSLAQFLDVNALYSASVGQQVGRWALAWNALFFVGGLMIAVGLAVPTLRVELAGLCLFFSATAINGSAILVVFGTRGIATTLTYAALAAAAYKRGMLVLRIVGRQDDDHGNEDEGFRG